MRISIIIISLLLFCSFCYCDILNVPQDYPAIQNAINESTNGDTILISNGIYNEDIDFIGKEITVASNFIFSSNPIDIENTIIDANDESYHVVKFINGESSNSKLIGLSITGGNANGSEGDDRGGGIYCSLDNSAPTIDYCYIYGNSALGSGGGIALEALAGELHISNCKIYNNEATGGGGIYLGSIVNKSYISNCEFFNNTATDGGAILNLLTQSEISNTAIHSNTSSQNGNAIMAFSGLIINKTEIYDNISNCDNIILINSFGVDREPMIITNSTIANNGIEYNKTINLLGNSKLIIVNSILSNFSEVEISATQPNDTSSINIAFSNIVRGQNSILVETNSELNWENNNLSVNPLFASQVDNNFELTENSPCIDAGTNNYEYDNATILLIPEEEYIGIAPDMGCYEFESANSEDSGYIDPLNYNLLNYPNPFNPSTTIDFSIQTPSNVELEIYNSRGQKVKSIQKGHINSGNHSIIWDGADDSMQQVSSGIYFYSLNIDNETKAVNRCLLLK